MKKRGPILFALVLVPLLLFGLYVWGALSWSYSSGERVGHVQKFSKKGWVCKTWEGELAMTPVPGAVPEKFLFTVRDEAVAQKINQLLSRRLSLSYQQHVGIPTSCFGETQYYIVGVRPLD